MAAWSHRPDRRLHTTRRDAAIRRAVALQCEAGVRTATNGAFRRTSRHIDFIYQLEGVDPTDQKLAVHFHELRDRTPNRWRRQRR